MWIQSTYLPRYLSTLPKASCLKIRRSLFILLTHQHSINDKMSATDSDTIFDALKGLLGPSNTALLHEVSGMCLAHPLLHGIELTRIYSLFQESRGIFLQNLTA